MNESEEQLWGDSENSFQSTNCNDLSEKPLTPVEKTFLLHAERGDCGTVRRIIEDYFDKPEEFDINCVDPLNRSALVTAIENENIELIRLLLDFEIDVKDGLLHAIKEEFVEAVEVLLEWEESTHKPGDSYSWEKVDKAAATFTSDVTPLILASHKNNYEIIKLLLDRGATLPVPHDIKCGCDECVHSIQDDSLRHSQARINAYKALTSPSLISLSSADPLLTAFELSWDLRRLRRMETEFRAEYNEMRKEVEAFATALLDHARTSTELMIMLNYDHRNPTWVSGERQTLERLKLAIKYKQKNFVAHPNVQQLLAAIWYEGLPGFRRKNIVGQTLQVIKFSVMFPVYCTIYMLAPMSKMRVFMRKPFIKFICHSSSYVFFLLLLGAASQRVEVVILEWFGTEWMQGILEEWKRKERGAVLGFAECGVILYVISLIWGEIKSLWSNGLNEYISDLWNIVDFITNFFYIIWFALRMSSWYITWRIETNGGNPWYPREQWNAFEPMLISEGAFAAGMIFSFLKLVHIFSVNPHLGPLQISLGRMIIDIVKFFFIYTLVLFAFGCGLNQLLWYYAELEKNKCYHLPSGLPDFENNDKACTIWRRYANLFETSQSLFWASFGLIDLMSFELTGIKSFTRFWALLMFGSYSVINVIVLLNMLIAMMSNSYQIISERADIEWKFARSRLWISYFEDDDILPPPFNILPNTEIFYKLFKRGGKVSRNFQEKSKLQAKEKHDAVIKRVVKRYITAEQRKRDEVGVTEDDVMEIRQDISTLRYEIINILHDNGMKTPTVSVEETQGSTPTNFQAFNLIMRTAALEISFVFKLSSMLQKNNTLDLVCGKKGKLIERRILNDFHIGLVEATLENYNRAQSKKNDIFGHIAKVVGARSLQKKRNYWNTMVRKSRKYSDPIGSSQEAESLKRRRQSLRRIDSQDVIQAYTATIPRSARLAANKFKAKIDSQKLENETEKPISGRELTSVHEMDAQRGEDVSQNFDIKSESENKRNEECKMDKKEWI